MPIASYKPYINTVIVLIITYHICVVVSGFEKVQPRKSGGKKTVTMQTDAIETKSECIEACSCEFK